MKKIKLLITAAPLIAIPIIAVTTSSMINTSNIELTGEAQEIYSLKSNSTNAKVVEINKEVSVDINHLFNILFPLLCLLLVVPIVILIFYKLKDKYKKGQVLEKQAMSNYSFISSLTNEIIEEVKGVSKITDEMQKDTLQEMGPKLNIKEGDK